MKAHNVKLLILIIAMIAVSSNLAFADWHKGKINQISIGYDGKMVTMRVDGWSRNNCTCYQTWSQLMCLDRTRDSFNDEYAMLLMLFAQQLEVELHINETTCMIGAISVVR